MSAPLDLRARDEVELKTGYPVVPVAATPQASLPAGYVELPAAERLRAARVLAGLPALISGFDPAGVADGGTSSFGGSYEGGFAGTFGAGYDAGVGTP